MNLLTKEAIVIVRDYLETREFKNCQHLTNVQLVQTVFISWVDDRAISMAFYGFMTAAVSLIDWEAVAADEDISQRLKDLRGE